MGGQVHITSRYSSLLVTFVIVAEAIICGGLFMLFSLHQGAELDTEHVLRSLVLVVTIYFAVTIEGGVNLHMRRSKDFEVALIVLKNVFYFSIASVFALHIGEFYVFKWQVYLVYLFTMLCMNLSFRYLIRYFAKLYHQMPANRRKVIMIGYGKNIVSLYHELVDNKAMGYDVLGYFNDSEYQDFDNLEYLGDLKNVIPYLSSGYGVQEVYCCLPSDFKSAVVDDIVQTCEKNFMHFYSVPRINNYLHQTMHLNAIGSIPYMSFYDDPLSQSANRMIKRCFDIVFSLLFLCTLFPIIFVIVAIVTKLTMPGPIFFKQMRSGMNGKAFTMYKFRSMKVNSQSDNLQATKDDPRKTKWGDILRKTSVDEMPQFINVLLGDMSVVGPRPHMIKHTEEYSQIISHYMVRHYIKPGVTGWSQVTGFRGETKELSQMEGRVKGDIWYMEHWSFWLDIYIIIRTVYNAIVGDKNAY